MSQTIYPEHSFGSWLGKGTVDEYRSALDHYRRGFEDAFLLKSLPIIPDTNVLLNHMHIPEELAERTRRFLENNHERVIIPHQIQLEHERHRHETPLLDDSGFIRLTPLASDTIRFLQNEFDTLASAVDIRKIKAELAVPYKAFPGLADVKKKPDRPYGDYLILHEMMAYALENETDVIFLTRDVDKGDWLTATRRAYPHVIETIRLATGRTIFILEAPLALAATLGDDSVTIPQPFTDTDAFRVRFLFMWERVKETLGPIHDALDKETKQAIADLRRVQRVLVQHGTIKDNGLLDDSWLYMMETLLKNVV